MGKALGIIGIAAGAILLIIGFLTFFAVFGLNLQVTFLVIPLIIMILGALLVAYGNRSYLRSKVDSTVGLKSVFCRHCGKKAVTGEYCSACGKSSQSLTTSMKVCRDCNSAMSDDSQYCANCGKQFQ
jgi:RNA polymerase subunit RPABC4/transcription elongation factor Spt4